MMTPFHEIERAARHAASIRALAGEIADLVCDLSHHTERLKAALDEGWTAEGIALVRLSQTEALLALAQASDRLLRLTERLP